MRYVILVGRIVFSYMFIAMGLFHLTGGGVDMAAQAGIPFASLTVPFGGLLALLGGLSLVFGYKSKYGAWLIILFLLPVTFTMHNFWAIQDPMSAMLQQVMFLKNLSMMGGALAFAYFGSGPLSVDAWLKSGRRLPQVFNKKVNT